MQVNHAEGTLLAKVLRKYGTIDLPAAGTSMYPYIKDGDICSFSACHPTHIKKGDIVLFLLENKRLVAHRLYSKNDEFFLFKGDTNLACDEPVIQEQIIGKLTHIKRRKKNRKATSYRAYIWSKLLLHIPITSLCLRFYLERKEKHHLQVKI